MSAGLTARRKTLTTRHFLLIILLGERGHYSECGLKGRLQGHDAIREAGQAGMIPLKQDGIHAARAAATGWSPPQTESSSDERRKGNARPPVGDGFSSQVCDPMSVHGARNTVPDDRSPATAADARAGPTRPASPQGDPRALQSDLERSLKESAAGEQTALGDAKPHSAPPRWTLTRRVVKIALGLALVGALGWVPLRTMLATTSVEALVNAQVETIRSPIEGIVAAIPGVAVDWGASGAAPRLRVVDPLADHAHLDDLRRQHQALESEARMLDRESEQRKTALETLDGQMEKFRAGRLKLLEARLAAQSAQIDSAEARATQAAADKRRTDELTKTGASTIAESDRRLYEWLIANSTEAAEKKRLVETKVEYDAIAQGVFVGDSYNDSPSSEQRAADLRLKAGELAARAVAVRSEMTLLAEQIAEEETRFRERSEADVDLPSSGRVWEMLTAAGERVGKGQDLMQVLDCSRPLVSANVDENVYNRLEVGGRATFRPSQRNAKLYDSVIVNLTGAAAASGNFAIPLAAMRKTSFYVTVAVDGMREGGCTVGRTGTVTFLTGDQPRDSADADAGTSGDPLAWLRAFLF